MGRQVTDVQKLVLFFATGASVFLVAMALGMRNVPFLVGACVVLLVTVTAMVIAVRSESAPRPAPAAPAPPRGAVAGHGPTTPSYLPGSAPVPGASPAPRVVVEGPAPRAVTEGPAPRAVVEEPVPPAVTEEPTVPTPPAGLTPTVRLPPRPPAQAPGPPADIPAERAPVNGHDPDGYDPADFETARLSPGPDPTDSFIDLIIDDEAELPPPPPEPTLRLPEGAAARGGTGLDAALPVADVARSLGFYHDILGLTVAYADAQSAVVESDGLRLLLDRVTDASGRAPRIGAVHLVVADLTDTCAQLRALGIAIVEPPAPVGRAEETGPESAGMWRARLRDPDGHEVELFELRGYRPAP